MFNVVVSLLAFSSSSVQQSISDEAVDNMLDEVLSSGPVETQAASDFLVKDTEVGDGYGAADPSCRSPSHINFLGNCGATYCNTNKNNKYTVDTSVSYSQCTTCFDKWCDRWTFGASSWCVGNTRARTKCTEPTPAPTPAPTPYCDSSLNAVWYDAPDCSGGNDQTFLENCATTYCTSGSAHGGVFDASAPWCRCRKCMDNWCNHHGGGSAWCNSDYDGYTVAKFSQWRSTCGANAEPVCPTTAGAYAGSQGYSSSYPSCSSASGQSFLENCAQTYCTSGSAHGGTFDPFVPWCECQRCMDEWCGRFPGASSWCNNDVAHNVAKYNQWRSTCGPIPAYANDPNHDTTPPTMVEEGL